MILKKYKTPNAKNYKEKVGFKNEKQTAYLIDFNRQEQEHSFVMHNVKFKVNGRTAQIDHLIITPHTCYVIEDKYFSGEVEIDENDSWNIKYKDKIISIPSPQLQNERHIEVLKDLFKEKEIFKQAGLEKEPALFDFVNVILISDQTIFKGKMPKFVKKASQVKDIGNELLKERLKNVNTLFKALITKEMSNEEAKKIAETLLKYDLLKEDNEVKNNSTINKTLDTDNILFEKLKKLRYELAKKENIKPYMVFSDKTLKEIVEKLPKTKEDMLKISGVGEVKYNKYGEVFLKEIKKHN